MREDALDRDQRQVAEVLVVDGVELHALDQAQQVRELHRDRAARGEQVFHAADEVVDVGHVGQHVVAQQQVGLAVFAGDVGGGGPAHEAHRRRDTLADGHLGDVGGRLDPQHRDAGGDEVLEQVAVVAGDFHHAAVRAQLEAIRGHHGVTARMFDPARRVGREVGVLAEDRVRRHELLQLHQVAVVADVGVQRVEGLHVAELVRRDVRLAQRAHAQIDEAGAQRRLAEAAFEGGGACRHVGRIGGSGRRLRAVAQAPRRLVQRVTVSQTGLARLVDITAAAIASGR